MNERRLRFSQIIGALIVFLVLGNGCRTVNSFRSSGERAPVLFSTAPDLGGLVNAINANTAEVRQLSCDIQIRMDGVPPLSGTLIVEKPRRMRLKAGLIGISEMGVDVGSNDEEFWVWNKSAFGGQAPAIYFAKHSEFAKSSMRQSIPFEPQWIIDALGLISLEPNRLIQSPLPRADGLIELRMETQTHNGPVTKTLVVDSKTGLVLQQAIYDAKMQLIAYSVAGEHQHFKEFHASLPRHIKLVVIGLDRRPNSLTVDLAGHEINQLYGDPDRQWTMPQPSDAQWFDLVPPSRTMIAPP